MGLYRKGVEDVKYYGHTVEGVGEEGWQRLRDHLSGVSVIASNFAGNASHFKDALQTAGLLHDFGKYQKDFQSYLRNGGRRGSVPHACWGAALARKLKMTDISMAIDGHHKGLPDIGDWKSDTNEVDTDSDEFLSAQEKFCKELEKELEELVKTLPNQTIAEERELTIRYLYSSLVDADWLDTESFCNKQRSELRTSQVLEYDKAIDQMNAVIANKPKVGEINRLRNDVREFAVSQANMPPSFFSMNLPTGMGKTLASVTWALHHAKFNSLKRIIIVLPFINIIDQTAQMLKEIFGEEFVLEHHSGYNENDNRSEDLDNHVNDITRELATENWDYPIIITTTVQFFESIFSNRRKQCRKVHNIAESVVIFDEVQSLRKELILPTLTMLKNFNSVLRTSFLFCTATQPAFEKRERFDGIEKIIPLVQKCEDIFEKTRRVSYNAINDYESIESAALVNIVTSESSSALCIFNTKKKALSFYEAASKKAHWINSYHLSTLMCPKHRKRIIEKVRDDLRHNIPILLVSTQLIEAGVDFDFPRVYREIAPMESIIQSAGRCNREGAMAGYGQVYIFSLTDEGMPDKQYRSLARHAIDMISSAPERLYGHDLFGDYYRSALNLFVDADKFGINNLRKDFKFEQVAGSYKIIDNKTRPVFVYNYNDESRELLNEIRSVFDKGWNLSRDVFRKVQLYSVQVYYNFITKNNDLLEALPQDLLVWHGGYSELTGIIDNQLTIDDYIV